MKPIINGKKQSSVNHSVGDIWLLEKSKVRGIVLLGKDLLLSIVFVLILLPISSLPTPK